MKKLLFTIFLIAGICSNESKAQCPTATNLTAQMATTTYPAVSFGWNSAGATEVLFKPHFTATQDGQSVPSVYFGSPSSIQGVHVDALCNQVMTVDIIEYTYNPVTQDTTNSPCKTTVSISYVPVCNSPTVTGTGTIQYGNRSGHVKTHGH